MDFIYLETFLDVCSTHNISKTAENLNISKTTAWNHIKKIENELGIKLFITSKLGTYLTKEGELFYKFADKTLYEYDYIKNRISTNTEIDLHIGVDNRILTNVFKNHLSKNSDFNLLSIHHDSAINNLYKGKFDLYIGYDTPSNKTIGYKMLCDNNLYLAVSTQNVLSNMQSISSSDIINQTIYYDTEFTTDTTDELINSIKDNNRIIYRKKYPISYQEIEDEGACIIVHKENIGVYTGVLKLIPLINSTDPVYIYFLTNNDNICKYVEDIIYQTNHTKKL